jgi:hypothetical protein
LTDKPTLPILSAQKAITLGKFRWNKNDKGLKFTGIMMKPIKYLKILFPYLLIIILLTLIAACSAPKYYVPETEKDFQKAFNRVYFHDRAEMEVPVKYGRIDLLTGDYAIEVERIDKFHEGIGQALHYARETGKKPGLAIFIIDPTEHDLEKLKYVRRLCQTLGIKVWYINEELEKAHKKK